MADGESEKLSIINEILRLEASTNDALRSSRDEIERLEIVSSQKKDEVEELERELNALLESRTKKKKRITLRPKRLRNLTISSAGDAAEELSIRLSATKRSESAAIADDNASCTYTVATFDKTDEMELASLWNSFRSNGDGDASTLLGGGSAVHSIGASHLDNMIIAKELLSQKQDLLERKQVELEQYQQQYNTNERMLQQMQQQLSMIQRDQAARCDEHNSTIISLNKTKSDLISRIKWRENRILEEEKNLAELKGRLAAAKNANAPAQCQSPSIKSTENDVLNELTKLISECAELLTNFSTSIFKMIESTITLPPHSYISFSIGDMSDTSTADTNGHKQQDMCSSLCTTTDSEDKVGADEQQQLDELQRSERQYDAKIRLIQNDIKSFQSTYDEEIDSNKRVLDDLQNQVTSLKERLVHGGNEIKRLVGEVESLNEKEQDLLEFINASDVYDYEE
ncbi:hypothetical protein ACHAWO_012614 [Cyclotella atomus]|uniref:Uncharacterized protein n=1 Tax=Cyclotella atomus TaxID=382360 RepID=A0ABD3PVI4_9STRA